MRKNPWAIPIIGFQILLICAALLFVAGLNLFAEGVAAVAYFMLISGVLAKLLLYRHNNKTI